MGPSKETFVMVRPTFVPATHPSRTPVISPSSTTHPYASLAATPRSYEVTRPPPASHPTPLTVPEFLRHPSKVPSDGHTAGKGGKIIVWLRNDLRLEDNPALAHAVEEADEIIPLYCFDPRHFGRTPFGFELTGPIRAKFLVEAVADVRKSLEHRGSGLVVRIGKPENVIRDICRRTGCKKVFYHKEVTSDAQAVEKGLEKMLKQENVVVKSFWSNSLHHPEDIPIALDSVPDCYSEFEEIMKKNSTVGDPLPAPKEMPAVPQIDHGKIPELSDLDLQEDDSIMWQMAEDIRGGESEAKKKLRKYLKQLRKAPMEKGACLYLASDFRCRISPWLALGCLSPRNIYSAVGGFTAASAKGSSTFCELLGQDFFCFIIYKYGRARLEDSKTGIQRDAGAEMRGEAPMAVPVV